MGVTPPSLWRRREDLGRGRSQQSKVVGGEALTSLDSTGSEIGRERDRERQTECGLGISSRLPFLHQKRRG
jgi:hypothetical protein